MKVESPYRYLLPCNVTLEKGASVVGEIPAAAKKHLNKLIAARIVKVLDTPKALPTLVVKTEQVTLPASTQSVSVKAHVSVDEPAKPSPPAHKSDATAPASSRNVDPVDVRMKGSRKKAED